MRNQLATASPSHPTCRAPLTAAAPRHPAPGVSVKTLQLYAGVFFFRCCSILVYDGYLPFDRSGDWLYQVVEVASMVLAIATIVLCLFRFRSTYDRSYDIFGTFAGMPTEMGALWIFLPCLLLAMVRGRSAAPAPLPHFSLRRCSWCTRR